MKNPSRRSFLKLGAAVAGGVVAFRSVPAWAAPGQDPAVVPNYSALSDLPEPGTVNVQH